MASGWEQICEYISYGFGMGLITWICALGGHAVIKAFTIPADMA